MNENKKIACLFAEWIGDRIQEEVINPFLIKKDKRWIQACGNSTSWTTEELFDIFEKWYNEQYKQ